MGILWSYLRPYRRLLALAVFLALINQLFSLLDPQILRIAIDRYASKGSALTYQEFVQGAWFLLGGIVGVAMVSRIAKSLQDYFVNVVTQSLGTKLYADGVEKVLSLPYQDFEDTQSGSILNQLQKARQDSQELIAALINNLFISFVTLIFVVGYAYTVHWSIGTAYVVMFPILGFCMAWLTRRIRKVQQAIFLRTTDLSGATTESIRNVELVKSLGLTQQEVRRLNTVNDEILSLELTKVRTVRMLSFLQGTAVNFIRALLMVLMFWLIYQGDLTVGEFLSLMMYSFFVLSPLNELGNVITKAQEASASLQNYQQIRQQPSEEVNSTGKVIKQLRSIEFKEVGYQYASGSQPALAEISFQAKAGQSIAFVGPSGAGKSTLVKLLLGLYRPLKGEILINGHSIAEIDWEAWRAQLGFVPQSIELFSGTLRDNLRFVQHDATDEECLAVLRQAQLGGLLDRAAEGLDARIGEGGLKLSGGERQRLAIARALLRQPGVLIFDEATSSLDSLTEQEIAQTIRSITKDRPRLLTIQIAHRLATVAQADQILVLERGQLVEQGTHPSLLKKSGLYAALWREQSAEVRPR